MFQPRLIPLCLFVVLIALFTDSSAYAAILLGFGGPNLAWLAIK